MFSLRGRKTKGGVAVYYEASAPSRQSGEIKPVRGRVARRQREPSDGPDRELTGNDRPAPHNSITAGIFCNTQPIQQPQCVSGVEQTAWGAVWTVTSQKEHPIRGQADAAPPSDGVHRDTDIRRNRRERLGKEPLSTACPRAQNKVWRRDIFSWKMTRKIEMVKGNRSGMPLAVYGIPC